jgi:hypothetical protein
VATLVKNLEIDAAEIEGILGEALKLELVPAAIACCEILGEVGTADLLDGVNGRQSKLIDAILFGDRSLQFAVLEAISTLDPQRPYRGSSYLVELAVFLAQSENRPAGLVGHLEEDIAQSYAATLAAAGVYGQAVGSSRKFFEAATSNPDFEVFLVTDTLDLPNYVELIQQLQNDWRTRRTPVALLYRDRQRSRRAQLRVTDEKLFLSAPLSLDPLLVASNVRRLNDLVQPWKLTNYDRRRHASAAIRWLAQISTDREKYNFYDLGKSQIPLTRLLYVPGYAERASQILANLGTPTAQRELVNYASQSGFPYEDRQKVVEAFRKSVQIGGTLLTIKEIEQQYERYQASKTEPAETQRVLGAILEAMEARKRDLSD